MLHILLSIFFRFLSVNLISGQFLDKLCVIPGAQAVTLDFKSPVMSKPPKVQNPEGSGLSGPHPEGRGIRGGTAPPGIFFTAFFISKNISKNIVSSGKLAILAFPRVSLVKIQAGLC